MLRWESRQPARPGPPDNECGSFSLVVAHLHTVLTWGAHRLPACQEEQRSGRVHVPTNEQRRQTAKRKLERQLARRAERAKRRRTVGVIITVVGVVAAVGLVYWLANLGGNNSPAAATDTSSP